MLAFADRHVLYKVAPLSSSDRNFVQYAPKGGEAESFSKQHGGIMYFKQFYLGCLAHASYLIGSQGEAVVVDPQRDVDQYLNEAATQGLTVKYVIETHLHADFVSGHNELGQRSGAEIVFGADARAAFPHKPVTHGEVLHVGSLVIKVLATPGHTPEGICLLITDSDDPLASAKLLTGDTLFIGDVGRPDLAGSKGFTAADMAEMLYDSLHNIILPLPDATEVYPAHGAGSMCGRNISKDTSSTLGLQRRTNYALQPMRREEFITMMTSELPEAPSYFSQDAEINRQGAGALATKSFPTALSAADSEQMLTEGAVLLDVRASQDFVAGHIPGSVNIGLGGQFASWAGVLLKMEQPIILIAEDEDAVAEASLRLARVGIESVAGYLKGGIAAWAASGHELRETPQLTADELQDMLTSQAISRLIDVRKPGEYNTAHVDGAIPLELSRLERDVDAVLPNRDAPIAVMCQGGYRSIAAVSLLERAGFTKVHNVVGGMGAWQAFQTSPATK
jgi:hydroxyacylglutathione hydrolase